MYLSIYNNLCLSRKIKPIVTNDIHKHHIIPKHSGGLDLEENFTYLSIREHIIAHFLLWKIHKNPNDLRAMKMLGAKLTSKHRQIIGLFCRDNKIGFHGASIEDKKKWRNKGLLKIKENGYTISKMSAEERKKFAALGGSIGGKKQHELKIGMFDPDLQKYAASLGGKSHQGKKCMYRPGIDKTFIRVSEPDWTAKLSEGYIFGSPIAPNTNKPSVAHRNRKCTDGINIYDSIKSMADHYIITSGAIIGRLKSKKYPTWKYVS